MKEIRISVATLALGASALIALGAVGVALLRPGGGSAQTTNSAAADGNVQQAPNPEAMIAEARERLRQDPDNDQGWFNLGMLYRGIGQLVEAEQAFRRAMELRPTNSDYVAYVGEMLQLRARGTPSPEAERLFRRALELDRSNPQARYYLATMRDMRGDHRGAVDELIALLRDAPAGAPWEPQVREAVTRIAEANRIEIANRLPEPRRSTATAAIPGPTREQMEAARSIPPSQQQEMVRGMVERLAARLRQNPRDADGWIMLMRSRMTMNQPQEATAALRSGLAAFPNDAAAQQRLRSAAEELGVPAG